MQRPVSPSDSQQLDIPDFRLLRPIGSGSYGEVWLARSVIGAYRAIKIVRRSQFDSEKAFEREFRGIEAFEPVSRAHAHLLQVLHVGRNEADGFYFYVMELADDATGAPISDPDAYVPKTLRSLVRSGSRLPATEAIQIGHELASGLSHLHGLGLVHRDIKPSNVVFVNGAAKLGDAGLVARSRDDMSLVGTEGYVPPEGMGRPQADLYSLGMVLYEISTGRCRQDFPEIPTDLPSREDKALFLQLNEIVLKACEPDSTRRFKTASDLLAALDRLQHEGVGRNGIHDLAQKKPRLWTAILTLIVLLILLFAYFALFRQSAENKPPTPETRHVPATAPGLSPTAKSEKDDPPPRKLNTEPYLPTEDNSPFPVPSTLNSPRAQDPVSVKTITTESADEFLRP